MRKEKGGRGGERKECEGHREGKERTKGACMVPLPLSPFSLYFSKF